MSYDITPPDPYGAGESLTQQITIEESGSAKDISGASVDWVLVPDRGDDVSEALLTSSDSGVTVSIVDGANDRLDVTIDQDVTTDYGGQRYWQRLTVDDASNNKQIWSGPFPIDRV
jgi:hypothetical protein